MSPEEKVILEKLESAVSENNRMLKKLVWQGKMNLWTKVIYWALIILITVGAFTLIKPLIGGVADIYAPEDIGGSFKMFGAQNAIEEFKSNFEE